MLFKIYTSDLDRDKNMTKCTTSVNVSIHLCMYLVSNIIQWHMWPIASIIFFVWGVRLLTEEASSMFKNTC